VTNARKSKAQCAAPQAVLDLSVAVIELYFRLEAATQAIQGFAHAGGDWGVLRMLTNGGPQTVPDMARSRPVSRQHCQNIVNGLRERGLVRLIDNPRHRRSPLIEITPKGRAYFDAMTERFLKASAGFAPSFGAKEVESATDLLRRAREILGGS